MPRRSSTRQQEWSKQVETAIGDHETKFEVLRAAKETAERQVQETSLEDLVRLIVGDESVR